MATYKANGRVLLLLAVIGATVGSSAAFVAHLRGQAAAEQCAYNPCKGIADCVAPLMPVNCTHTRCNTGPCVAEEKPNPIILSPLVAPVVASCGNGICEPGEKNICPACSKNIPPCLSPCIAGTCNRDCITDWEDAICGDGVCVEQERAIVCPSCVQGIPSSQCTCSIVCEKDCRFGFSSALSASSKKSSALIPSVSVSSVSESSSSSVVFRSFCGDGRCDAEEGANCSQDCSSLSNDALCGNGQCDPGEWERTCSIPGPNCIPTMVCERDCAVVEGTASSANSASAPLISFTDLSPISPIGQAAAFLARRGILNGYPDGTFRPEKLVQRDEIAKMITTAIVKDFPAAPITPVFRDVPVSSWSWPYIYAAAGYRIVRGHPDGTYRPTDPVNTAEFLKMISIAFRLPQGLRHDYVDVVSDAWYAPFAGIAEQYALFPERTLLLDPSRPMTRGAVAGALWILLQK